MKRRRTASEGHRVIWSISVEKRSTGRPVSPAPRKGRWWGIAGSLLAIIVIALRLLYLWKSP